VIVIIVVCVATAQMRYGARNLESQKVSERMNTGRFRRGIFFERARNSCIFKDVFEVDRWFSPKTCSIFIDCLAILKFSKTRRRPRFCSETMLFTNVKGVNHYVEAGSLCVFEETPFRRQKTQASAHMRPQTKGNSMIKLLLLTHMHRNHANNECLQATSITSMKLHDIPCPH
jgi:hypothetical protein